MNSEQLASILYFHRFCPNDQVGSLIESLILHFNNNDPNFDEHNFRAASDYPYDSNGNLLQEMHEYINYSTLVTLIMTPVQRDAMDRLHKEVEDE